MQAMAFIYLTLKQKQYVTNLSSLLLSLLVCNEDKRYKESYPAMGFSICDKHNGADFNSIYQNVSSYILVSYCNPIVAVQIDFTLQGCNPKVTG